MAGSTEIMNTYGGYHFFQLFNKLEDMFIDVATKENCLYRKGLGDGFMSVFKENAEAIRTSIEIMRAVKEYNKTADEQTTIDIRIGIDYGETNVRHDGDRLGIPVSAAARIESLQAGNFSQLQINKDELPVKGRIFITYIAYSAIKDNPDIKCSEVGWAELKGIEGVRYDIFLVDWENSA